jgi:plastocyanin
MTVMDRMALFSDRGNGRRLVAGGLTAVILAVASLGAVAQDGGPGQAAAVIEMTDLLAFDPGEVTVRAGETVEWRNASNIRHTVTADPDDAADPDHVALPDTADPFDSGLIDPGGVWRRTFDVPGTYTYFCIPHESTGMVGKIIVRPGE